MIRVSKTILPARRLPLMAELESQDVRNYIERKNQKRRRQANSQASAEMPAGAIYDWDAETFAAADEDLIEQWTDSLFGNVAEQPDPTYQPKIRMGQLNGKNYVEFYELTWMDLTSPVPDTQGTFLFVFSSTQEQAAVIVCNGVALYACVGNENNFQAYTDQEVPDSGFLLNIGGWQAMAVRFHHNGSAEFFKGGIKNSFVGANAGYINRGGTALGAEPLGGGNNLHGGIARLAFYSSLLSDQQIFSGLDYLENFYSL